ncbi:MAG: hypothetical protein A4E49_03170 [Methanosaeta sp. PtaU1.Bin112]|nr:MAG: hypothetical protein A4E49_03170 [Methanosaeta sp. PtaU1.Bin112]
MASKRRSDQILSEILDACQGKGEIKTKIVYRVNLNFKTVNLHLDILLANELLEMIDGPLVLYRTTEKGAQVLELMKEIERLMPVEISS